MTRAELRQAFLKHLNRTDCTSEQADEFVSLARRRLERSLRIPLMERTKRYSADHTGAYYIPNDYIELIGVYVDGKRLTRVSDGEGHFLDEQGVPVVFFRDGVKFQIRGKPRKGSVVLIKYYGEFEELKEDNYESLESAIIPDIMLYQALIFASDFFLDERKSLWKAELAEMLTEVQGTADRDEMSGRDLRMSSPFQGIDY